MDSSSAAIKGLGFMSILGTLAVTDLEPIITVIFAFLAATVAGALTAQFVGKEAQAEIDNRFEAQAKIFRKDFSRLKTNYEALIDDVNAKLKSGG